jgi:hypothetical protein
MDITYSDDGPLVGTDAIFSVPNVIAPSATDDDDGIPAPSIYYDCRGEIHNIKVNNNQRINILFTKAGYLRSGDIHRNVQCDFIFTGKVKVWTLSKDGSTTIQCYNKHDFIQIPKGVPHIFEFVEDTCMAEWWEPQGFQAWFYKPYREIVDKSFRTMIETQCQSTGKDDEHGMVLLVPLVASNVRRNRVFMMIGAFCIGVAGYALGCKAKEGNKYCK